MAVTWVVTEARFPPQREAEHRFTDLEGHVTALPTHLFFWLALDIEIVAAYSKGGVSKS